MKVNNLFCLFMDAGFISPMIFSDESPHLEEFTKLEDKLENMLNEEQKKVFKDFYFKMRDHFYDIRDKEICKVMNECIKIGMDFNDYFIKKYQ